MIEQDRDRIDTLTANCWAAMYREDGMLNLSEAAEVIHNAESYPGVVALLLEYLQQPERQQELSMGIAELLADIARDEYSDEVQKILAAEAEQAAAWPCCADEAQESERLDEYRQRLGGGVA